jgi:DNA-binding transcriptional ArsR family regulator
VTAYALHDRVCDALGDGTRRSILEELRREPRSVRALAADLPVSRPAVSQHLRVLTEAGLVGHRQDGTRHVYHVEPDGLQPLRAWLDGFWQDVLDTFAEHVRSTS